MKLNYRYIFILIPLIYSWCGSEGQLLDFNGQIAAWITANNSGGLGLQAGGRYLPPDIASLSVDDCVMRWKAEWEGGA